MKISVTGTFSVPRKEVEGKISEIGHKVVDFSGKTEILLVGEKTASPKKIGKAEAAGIRIIREVEAEKIFSLLSGLKYRDHYERGVEEDWSGEQFFVGLAHVEEAYKDFAHVNADAGEWNAQDIEAFLKHFDRETFCAWINVKIDPAQEADFWKVLRRLMIMDYVSWEQCQHEGEPIVNIRELALMTEEEFAGNILNLSLFKFDDAETRKEFLEDIKEGGEDKDMKRILEIK